VNDVRQEANKFGAPHEKELETVPLKVFMRCHSCDGGYTRYIVKKETCGTINAGQREAVPIKVQRK
jgi:hypothetical protein